jgi:Zn-dependent metalloprotease
LYINCGPKPILEMKKAIIILILSQLFGCVFFKDCPDVIKGKPKNHIVSDKDLSSIKSLFSYNGLSLDNYQFYQLQRDELGYAHVRCFQFVNNLKLLSDDLIFHFDNHSIYNFLSGTIISNIEVDSSPTMNVSEVKNIFLKRIDEDDSFYGNKRKIENDCFLCELGYWDLNAGISYSTPDFRLAWKIKSDQSDYPMAIINDSEESIIYYDNGIRY